MPSVVVSDVTKAFGDVVASNHVTFKVEEGTLQTLLGPSGCGKTTILRIIAGLERADSGEVLIGDKIITSTQKRIFIPPEKRNLGMVFQSYAVWPHMRVFDNVAFPLRIKRSPKSEIKRRVMETLALVNLEGLEQRYPSQLSGGQQQRIAVARALVYGPQVLLLDEPLSNLDAKLREHMRFELKELQRKLGITSIYVTHDQEEAMVISDKVVVMDHGKIMQIGTAFEVYTKPESEFVASFIGSTNFIPGKIFDILKDEHCLVETACGRLFCPIPKDARKGKKVLISIRPEHIALSRKKPEDSINLWKGQVKTHAFLGKDMDYRILVEDQRIRALTSSSLILKDGESVFLSLNPKHILLLKGAPA